MAALVASTKKREDSTIAYLVFKSLNNLSPKYIQDLLEVYKSTTALGSPAFESIYTIKLFRRPTVLIQCP